MDVDVYFAHSTHTAPRNLGSISPCFCRQRQPSAPPVAGRCLSEGERQRDFVDPTGKGSTGRPPHLIQKVPSRSANLETLIDYQPTQPGRWHANLEQTASVWERELLGSRPSFGMHSCALLLHHPRHLRRHGRPDVEFFWTSARSSRRSRGWFQTSWEALHLESDLHDRGHRVVLPRYLPQPEHLRHVDPDTDTGTWSGSQPAAGRATGQATRTATDGGRTLGSHRTRGLSFFSFLSLSSLADSRGSCLRLHALSLRMWDTPNDHSRGHSRTLVRTTILVVAYLTTIPNLMPNRMSLLSGGDATGISARRETERFRGSYREGVDRSTPSSHSESAFLNCGLSSYRNGRLRSSYQPVREKLGGNQDTSRDTGEDSGDALLVGLETAFGGVW
eukprot:COSAG01_NODE_5325_length_4333_cov_27.694851_6_plen_390_part_00